MGTWVHGKVQLGHFSIVTGQEKSWAWWRRRKPKMWQSVKRPWRRAQMSMREIRRRWGCFRVKYGSLREFNQPKIVILWELISGFLLTKHGDPTGTSGISPIEQWLLDQYIGGLSQSMNGESLQYEPTSTRDDTGFWTLKCGSMIVTVNYNYCCCIS